MLACLVALALARVAPPQSIWLEAEWFGPLKGANFSFMSPDRQTRGSWSVAGPDAAAGWTQGGESEWMSVAARADEPGEIAISRDVEVSTAGAYTLWVRYADYRGKKSAFGVRVRQAARSQAHVFGQAPIVDEMDPMKLLWGWAYAWDHAEVSLEQGTARVEIYTTGPTGARRAVDCLCLTTDQAYHPVGREKPDAPVWKLLRAGTRDLASLPPARAGPVPAAWRIANGPPAFLWNVGAQWLDGLASPPAARVDAPFTVDPPLLGPFVDAWKGRQPPVYASPLSGPIPHIPLYPSTIKPGSALVRWLDAHPESRFGILLNYGDPSWPASSTTADRQAVHATLKRFGDRFAGFVAGENLAYENADMAELERRVRAAKTRGEILSALRDVHTAAARAKFADYFGEPVGPDEAWSPVISCLSASNEAFCHALCAWGCRRIGHENTGNSPTLARRLAFLRGAARQFGAKMVDYQSCNLGDSATMYSRELYFYPASSRYVMDNQYDVWAGAGMNWLLKDYVLWYMAGVDAFYNEQGVDLYWKPGGGVAGDAFPVQLSPKGLVAEAAVSLAEKHPRGTQYTPIAFLLDEAHGWSQENFQPGAFGLDPAWNPALLTPGPHEASIRGWFDVAYYPAPETQNDPATAIRQTYVDGVFGDIFDVIVTAPKRTAILQAYPVVIAAGLVSLSDEWGRALRMYVEHGGTLVVCADQMSGPGAAALGLTEGRTLREASAIRWAASNTVIPCNVFHVTDTPRAPAEVLASTDDGTPAVVAQQVGRGRLITIAIPLGLGIDQRPTPASALVLEQLAAQVTPVRVAGDVEWAANRLDDGGWAVTLLNNGGVAKPEHGMLPTDQRAAQAVSIRLPFPAARCTEWMTGADIAAQIDGSGSLIAVTVPAGAVRIVEVKPAGRSAPAR